MFKDCKSLFKLSITNHKKEKHLSKSELVYDESKKEEEEKEDDKNEENEEEKKEEENLVENYLKKFNNKYCESENLYKNLDISDISINKQSASNSSDIKGLKK